MATSQIHDMDIIAYPGTIFRRIIITENGQLLQPAYRNLGNVRHEIIWNTMRIFTDQATGMGTDWIEITEYGNRP